MLGCEPGAAVLLPGVGECREQSHAPLRGTPSRAISAYLLLSYKLHVTLLDLGSARFHSVSQDDLPKPLDVTR